MTNGSLMKVESIAECSPWSILQYFWPALSDNWSWKPIFVLYESGRFTQVLLYQQTYVVSFSSCLNGGICFDGVNSYRCQCPSNFSGSNCQHRRNPCDSYPCMNGAACYLNADTGGHYCECPIGFTGPTCKVCINWPFPSWIFMLGSVHYE